MNKLLQMAKLDSKSIEPEKKWLETRDVIHKVLQDLGPLTYGRSISVEVKEGAERVFADETLTKQILQNLIENSILHTSMEAAIKIESWLDSKTGNLHFRVTDSGQGFPTEKPELMFEKFKRGTEDPEQRGSGLGLAICEGLVEVQGGKISASNRPEGGAIVEFFLPQPSNGV
jgi:two-component system sensor histidine kinase KdpD